MNHALKLGLLVSAIGLALPATTTNAALGSHNLVSNAINYCQAFTPGPANTIRNRVVGAENIGSAPIAVACNFHSMANGSPGVTNPTLVTMWFSNNNTVGSLTVTCTLLTGFQSQGGTTQYAVTKTTGAIAAGGNTQDAVRFDTADNPNAGATDLGNRFIGINCTLPQGAVMNDTYLFWIMDNGV